MTPIKMQQTNLNTYIEHYTETELAAIDLDHQYHVVIRIKRSKYEIEGRPGKPATGQQY